MKVAQVKYDEILILDIKKVAIKNGLKTTIPDLVELAVIIASNSCKHMEDEEFLNINDFKKIAKESRQ
jgi:hypothetical protein